jgi:hypothetical protein
LIEKNDFVCIGMLRKEGSIHKDRSSGKDLFLGEGTMLFIFQFTLSTRKTSWFFFLSVIFILGVLNCSERSDTPEQLDAVTAAVDLFHGEMTSDLSLGEEVDVDEMICEPRGAVVTDIDGTLTTQDLEFLAQMEDGTYDPLEREGASDMISVYAEMGYFILYLTGRGENIEIPVTNETAREATMRWLEEHGFPIDEETTQLTLAPQLLTRSDSIAYKSGAVMALQEQGYSVMYAYGNSSSEYEAYSAAGIPPEGIYIISAESGIGGSMPVIGENWLDHIDTHVSTAPPVCQE